MYEPPYLSIDEVEYSYVEKTWHFALSKAWKEKRFKDFFAAQEPCSAEFAEKLRLLNDLASLHGWGKKKEKGISFDYLKPGTAVFFGKDDRECLMQECMVLDRAPGRVLLQSKWDIRTAVEKHY